MNNRLKSLGLIEAAVVPVSQGLVEDAVEAINRKHAQVLENQRLAVEAARRNRSIIRKMIEWIKEKLF